MNTYTKIEARRWLDQLQATHHSERVELPRKGRALYLDFSITYGCYRIEKCADGRFLIETLAEANARRTA